MLVVRVNAEELRGIGVIQKQYGHGQEKTMRNILFRKSSIKHITSTPYARRLSLSIMEISISHTLMTL